MTTTHTQPDAATMAVHHARAELIALLNDDIRRRPTGPGKRTVVTRAVSCMGPEFQARMLAAIASHADFSSGNNVHRERDYGVFAIDGRELMFKIDYYDADGLYASEDPTDPAQTLRVMTILFTQEY